MIQHFLRAEIFICWGCDENIEGQTCISVQYVLSMLQVLISIQSLILCAEPYYNEPGFERMYGTTAGDAESHKYSEDVFKNNLKHAVLGQLSNPPEGFEDVVKSHFYLKRWVLIKVRQTQQEMAMIFIQIESLNLHTLFFRRWKRCWKNTNRRR